MQDGFTQPITANRNYNDAEIAKIYTLGRFYLEVGQFRSAESIFRGLITVKPDFTPPYLGLVYIHILQEEFTDAALVIEQAAKSNVTKSNDYSIKLFLLTAITQISLGDLAQAGTALGEVSDQIERGNVTDANMVKLFKSQLVRYQSKKNSY